MQLKNPLANGLFPEHGTAVRKLVTLASIFLAGVSAYGVACGDDLTSGQLFFAEQKADGEKEGSCKPPGIYRFTCDYDIANPQHGSGSFAVQVKETTINDEKVWECTSVQVRCFGESPTKEVVQECCEGYVAREDDCSGVSGRAKNSSCPDKPRPSSVHINDSSDPAIIDGLDEGMLVQDHSKGDAQRRCKELTATDQRMLAACENESAFRNPASARCGCTEAPDSDQNT